MAIPTPSASSSNNNAAILSTAASSEARFFANAIASWYVNTIDPYTPHAQNIESRLRHPIHVVTRRILFGNVHAAHQANGGDNQQGLLHTINDLEAAFNDDDAEIKDGPEALTRRTAARMEAFLASCSTAVREEYRTTDNIEEHTVSSGMKPPITPSAAKMSNNKEGSGENNNNKNQDGNKKRSSSVDGGKPGLPARTISSSSSAPKVCRQIDRGELLFRLEIYCRALRRIRSLSDANPGKPMEECVIRYESKKGIRSRVRVIVQTYLRNVDCVRDVHKTLMTLVLRATLEVLAVEVWCPELRGTVDRLASEYEHKVSFASLAFLSSPDNSAENHLAPLLTKYFEYLQMEWESLVTRCELERMLRTVVDSDLRHYFKTATFHSVGHILDECRRERESLDNIALPPPWKEGVFGMAGSSTGGDTKGDIDAAMKRYCSDAALVKQALRDLRREVITVNGQILPPAHSHMELAEHLGQVLKSKQMMLSLSSPHGSSKMFGKRSRKKRMSNYTSDFGLELESDFSGTESDASLAGKIDVGLVDVLARRLLIAASRTGTGGDAYFIVCDLFGGDEVEVVPHHSSGKQINQGTIEIIVKMSSVIIKSHAKFDIFPKPIVSDTDALIQFHTTTTETITLQPSHEGKAMSLKEKKTNMTGWRTLAVRPAYYERVPQM